MPDSPAPFDFGFPPAPGGGFPQLIGDPAEELGPAADGSGGGGSASYENVYSWQVD